MFYLIFKSFFQINKNFLAKESDNAKDIGAYVKMHISDMYNQFAYIFTNYFNPNEIKRRANKSLTDLFASVSFIEFQVHLKTVALTICCTYNRKEKYTIAYGIYFLRSD